MSVDDREGVEQGGVVGDFHGDAAMGFWGWPLAQPDAIERACRLFGCGFANVQPNSGSQANQAVFLALLQPGDVFMGLDLAAGGLKALRDQHGPQALAGFGSAKGSGLSGPTPAG